MKKLLLLPLLLVLSLACAPAATVNIDEGIGPVSPSGTRVVHPATTRTYNLTATNPNGTARGAQTILSQTVA
jgi:hypothetical protein